MISLDSIVTLMAKKGPIVKAVKMNEHGKLSEITLDMTPSKNILTKELRGNATFVGMFHNHGVVLVCVRDPVEGVHKENKGKLPYPFHVLKEPVSGDVLMVKMGDDNEPLNFDLNDWVNLEKAQLKQQANNVDSEEKDDDEGVDEEDHEDVDDEGAEEIYDEDDDEEVDGGGGDEKIDGGENDDDGEDDDDEDDDEDDDDEDDNDDDEDDEEDDEEDDDEEEEDDDEEDDDAEEDEVVGFSEQDTMGNTLKDGEGKELNTKGDSNATINGENKIAGNDILETEKHGQISEEVPSSKRQKNSHVEETL